ncbi:TetR/AcrR family transcriptional regulator [Alloscardovia theropitheci]|uniref:TetR/AcrR family transcriptional regulator n=1 Tax=Alloscardovia theropitheci TaxID=2496842 RepID=A0A4V2MTT1_9BIFI|nr:TetR/AcrR family transcriptional regulator [Alloscardovia theropitheci]TCD53649.1 TetR/AcrR family transcriptional regulator [Alloscardovia theropitheci]
MPDTMRIHDDQPIASNEHSIRWQRTHALIRQSYSELLHTLGPDDITVSAITDHAHIHRKTFYLHYDSLEAIYEEYATYLAKEYSRTIEKLPRPFNYYDLSRTMFEFYTSSPEIERIFASAQYRQLANDIILQTTQHSRSLYNPYRNFSPAEQELINTFVVYSSVNVWRRWTLSGKNIPMADAIKLLGDLLEHGVAPLRAPYTYDGADTEDAVIFNAERK